MERFITTGKNGKKTWAEIIEYGRAWRKEKEALGWQDTPDGLQPMTEIRKAGYVLNENDEWRIPSEQYMADGNGDRKAGEKYLGISSKYLNWKRQKEWTNKSNKTQESTKEINFNESEPPRQVSEREIVVDDIPF